MANMDRNNPTGHVPVGHDNPQEPAQRQIQYFYNNISLVGFILFLMGFVFGLAFILMDLASGEPSGYSGVSYVLFLTLILIGTALGIWGALRKRHRQRLQDPAVSAGELVIDFSKISVWWVIGLSVVAMLIPLSVVVGSYQVYHATESNEFCGQMCHSVMQPEYVTYHYSSHARVDCVACHIGSGATWFVRSKISGLSQVLAVTMKSYPRPISTPIHNLRPARDTCEKCHWPSKFIGYKEFVRSYYLSDQKSMPYKIRMLMKIGGEKSKLVSGSGIHYHMLIASKVEYIARDSRRQDIPWVRITHNDGSVTEYANAKKPLTDAEKSKLEMRIMDCMDCHNRPAHQFPTPMKAVNSSIEQGLISRDLPFIKLEATRALDRKYKSVDEAYTGIATYLRGYYRERYPNILSNGTEGLRNAISEVQAIYGRTIFPEMKVSWSQYPDNIGHRDWKGCFRCHNDNMKSQEGFTIFTTCDKCHLILAQGENVDQVKDVDFLKGQAFLHPGRKGEKPEKIDEFTECVDCHSGGAETYD